MQYPPTYIEIPDEAVTHEHPFSVDVTINDTDRAVPLRSHPQILRELTTLQTIVPPNDLIVQ